ncbi:hypothetical protein HYV21_01175 [Candidatus Microgenomates bacterium]|nr:hypothetical protein [Candidatus Microgenomates bacterium]
MKKILIASILLFLTLIAFAKISHAAFLIIDEQGNLVWQVLSEGSDDGDRDRSGESSSGSSSSSSSGSGSSGSSDSSSSVSSTPKPEEENEAEGGETRIEVRTTNRGTGTETGTEVRIRTEEGRVRLEVSTPSGQTEMDVTEMEGDIVRIREREEEQEIRIRARNGRIEIRQRGVGALTNFPVSVNPETNELTVTTPSGTRVVTILPSVAVANILQSNIMDRILTTLTPTPSPATSPEPTSASEAGELEEAEQEIELEEEGGVVVFKIRGIKDARFLNIFPTQTPVTALVSVQTGEVLSVERPWFLNLFGFLFAQ